jgi:DNA-binding transcriptional MerR regulator/methylmalonyl-CoA mutase cobalamin-binding subunit
MNPTEKDTEPRHPIRVVAHRTGLTPSALRAWERRYGAVVPRRSGGGQRLYSDADVRRLSLLRRVTEAGRSISQVAELREPELLALVEADEVARSGREAERAPGAGGSLGGVIDRCLDAVRTLDAVALESELRWVMTTHGAESFTDLVVVPVLTRIGEGWSRGELSPAHEHLASEVIHRVAGQLLSAADRPTLGRGRAVIATLPGESHDLGALLAAVTAKVSGWSVTFLGANLPGTVIAEAARSVGADLIGLSLVNPNGNEALLEAELSELLARADSATQVVLGGAAGERIALGLFDLRIVRVRTLEDFRAVLREGPVSTGSAT